MKIMGQADSKNISNIEKDLYSDLKGLLDCFNTDREYSSQGQWPSILDTKAQGAHLRGFYGPPHLWKFFWGSCIYIDALCMTALTPTTNRNITYLPPNRGRN